MSVYVYDVKLFLYKQNKIFPLFLCEYCIFTVYLYRVRLIENFHFIYIFVNNIHLVKENFDNLTPNYAGAESKDVVAAGILNFQHNGVGHQISAMCLR